MLKGSCCHFGLYNRGSGNSQPGNKIDYEDKTFKEAPNMVSDDLVMLAQ